MTAAWMMTAPSMMSFKGSTMSLPREVMPKYRAVRDEKTHLPGLFILKA